MPCHRGRVPSRVRVVGRRVVVVAVVLLQLGFVARAYWSDHKEFGYQMFPESSTWRADVGRVTTDGRRVPIERPWSGYQWDELVQDRGLRYPGIKHHADAGFDDLLGRKVSMRALALLRVLAGPVVLLHLQPFLSDGLRGRTYRDSFYE